MVQKYALEGAISAPADPSAVSVATPPQPHCPDLDMLLARLSLTRLAPIFAKHEVGDCLLVYLMWRS